MAKKHFYEVEYAIEKTAFFTRKGRPQKNQEAAGFTYQVKIRSIASRLGDINKKRATLGRFILATNILDKAVMSNEDMLIEYKEQSEIERGFRFIKNDTFGLDEVYLKKPERMGSLMAIMTLCLLVYGLTQYQLREALKKHDEVLPNQKKRPTQSPTLMWIFTLFSSVIMINLPEQQNGKSQRVMMNLHPLHQKVILLLGETARKIYLLPEHLTLTDIELNQKTWLRWCGM